MIPVANGEAANVSSWLVPVEEAVVGVAPAEAIVEASAAAARCCEIQAIASEGLPEERRAAMAAAF